MVRVNADVWVLTEAHTDVSPGKDYHLVSHSSRTDGGAEGECWVGIWSRVEAHEVITADQNRSAAIEIVISEHRSMVILGTVLPWIGSSWRGISARGGLAFAAALDLQLADWMQIRAGKPGRELCVAGDFNQDLLDSGHYYGSKAGRSALRSAISTAGLSSPLTHPHDAIQQHTNNASASIDHIFISGGLETSTRRIDVWPLPAERRANLSDHFGVSIEVSAS